MTNKTLVRAVAPTRICDIGGWTDTWFARYGAVFNIAVYPYVEVQISIVHGGRADRPITIYAENFGDTYTISPDAVTYEKHPLIEAAVRRMRLPDGHAFRIDVYSEAPPGASMGTSAAVSVALIGALNGFGDNRLTAYEVASLAHAIETEDLHLQCGIQDQLASAYGGISLIQMHDFPHASVSPIQIPDTLWWELEHRLALVYVGKPHRSSDIHKQVIAALGEDAHADSRLQRLRTLALEAKAALYRGDFDMFGRVMNENTEVQRALHKALVCEKFEEVMTMAREYNALGCKVNGAGGDGGSITILTNGDLVTKRKLLKALGEKGYRSLPIYLSRQGLRVA